MPIRIIFFLLLLVGCNKHINTEYDSYYAKFNQLSGFIRLHAKLKGISLEESYAIAKKDSGLDLNYEKFIVMDKAPLFLFFDNAILNNNGDKIFLGINRDLSVVTFKEKPVWK